MNNYIVIYDGTFLNLLSTIKYLFQEKIKPSNITSNEFYQSDLFTNILKPDITDDPKFLNTIENNSNKEIIKIITYVFLSANENKELIIYYFLLNTFIFKDKVIYQRNLNCVNKALQIKNHVSRENHKLKGFIRFKMINNKFLYAEISPDNNILELLSEHFKKRLKNELWIIKDTKRNILSIYDLKNYYIVSADNLKILELDQNNDTFYEDLWQTFFDTIAIKERINKKKQMSFMPKKYWHNIIEMESEL